MVSTPQWPLASQVHDKSEFTGQTVKQET